MWNQHGRFQTNQGKIWAPPVLQLVIRWPITSCFGPLKAPGIFTLRLERCLGLGPVLQPTIVQLELGARHPRLAINHRQEMIQATNSLFGQVCSALNRYWVTSTMKILQNKKYLPFHLSKVVGIITALEVVVVGIVLQATPCIHGSLYVPTWKGVCFDVQSWLRGGGGSNALYGKPKCVEVKELRWNSDKSHNVRSCWVSTNYRQAWNQRERHLARRAAMD